MQKSTQKMKKIWNSLFIREKMLTIFGWNFEIWAVQKYVNLVDLVKSFPTRIYLQKSASIQPRTSLSKLGENSIQYSFASLDGGGSGGEDGGDDTSPYPGSLVKTNPTDDPGDGGDGGDGGKDTNE